MIRHIAKRLLFTIPLVLAVTIVCFTLIQIAPGDPVTNFITPRMSSEVIASTRMKYGLDRPIYVQYFYWLRNILQGDFGYSLVTHESISKNLASRIPASAVLIVPAYFASIIVSLVLGLLSAFRRDKIADKAVDGFTSIAMSIPIFCLAFIVIYLFGYILKLFPIFGMYTIGKEGDFADFLRHLVLPCFVLMFAFLPEQTRYIRSSGIREMVQDYVIVQRSYGAGAFEILVKNVLRNVMLPVVTLLGLSLPLVVTGAFVTENIFAWPGVGTYFVNAIKGSDYPVVMGVLLLSSTLVILGNLLSDILYGLVDPRIRLGRGRE